MYVRYLIAAASAALLSSSLALAQEPAPEAIPEAAPTGSDESCATLQSKFDKDVLTAKSATVGQAQSLREQGGKLCSEGKSAEGIGKLKEAITVLHEQKPAQAPQQ